MEVKKPRLKPRRWFVLLYPLLSHRIILPLSPFSRITGIILTKRDMDNHNKSDIIELQDAQLDKTRKEHTNMKLYLSRNIKKLRQSKAMTQEELAESLGVSFQSVSRWENGLSYPDIELIPEIAAFFEVSTDVLMGVEQATAEQNLAKDMKRVRMDEFNSREECLAFLKEMHRKYPHDAETLIRLIYALSAFPEHSDEMRKKIRQYLCHPHAEKVYIDQAVRLLIASEEEAALPSLLARYAAEEDMSRPALLQYRAQSRGGP